MITYRDHILNGPSETILHQRLFEPNEQFSTNSQDKFCGNISAQIDSQNQYEYANPYANMNFHGINFSLSKIP